VNDTYHCVEYTISHDETNTWFNNMATGGRQTCAHKPNEYDVKYWYDNIYMEIKRVQNAKNKLEMKTVKINDNAKLKPWRSAVQRVRTAAETKKKEAQAGPFGHSYDYTSTIGGDLPSATTTTKTNIKSDETPWHWENARNFVII